jgi:hypothetical protein
MQGCKGINIEKPWTKSGEEYFFQSKLEILKMIRMRMDLPRGAFSFLFVFVWI